MQDFVWKKDSTHCHLKGLKNPLLKSTVFQGMVADASNLCPWEAEAGELRALESEYVGKLGYNEALFKKNKTK